ncbi:MAG TPA: chloride channel protein [Verrucomicrobiae bacterium]|nr:chloride channel protein [Verrucomicrobiae bacterium]
MAKRAKLPTLGAAVAIGVINAIVFKLFELAVNHGTDYVWNGLFDSDKYRWVVVPLAVVLSIGLSALFRVAHRKRIGPPKLDSLSSEDMGKSISLGGLGMTATIGIGSLIAGASLGPEASLVMLSTGLGTWIAAKTGLQKVVQLLILASVGALLVAFCGSVIPILIPLLLLQQKRRLTPWTASIVTLAGFAAFAMLWLMDPGTAGYGTIPARPHASLSDVALAVGVGICAAGLGWSLKHIILQLAVLTKHLDTLPWPISSAAFGLPIGLLYLLAGESIQFSGNQGSAMLLHHAPAYGLWALIGLLTAKLVATAWSLASGYQGGLVFPSIYLGVAMALIAANLSGTTSPGVLIGGIAGVFGAMTGPPVALIFIISILPIKLAGTAVAGIIGSVIGNKCIAKLSTKSPAD